MTAQNFTSVDYLDALLSLPKLFGELISRNGKYAAWMWMGIGKAIDIYVAPTDGSTAPIQLTNSLQNSYLVSWLPNSDGVIVARDHDGDERLQLFKISLDTPGNFEPLTESTPNYYIRGGQLHPNGKWLIYAANFDVESGKEIEATWVYRQDLETGERLPLARPQRGASYVPELNSVGTHILYNRKDVLPSGYQLWLVDIMGKQDIEIVNVGDDKKVYGSWFPDGNHILIRAETATHFRVGIWDLATRSLRWLIDDPRRYIESAYLPFRSSHIVINEVRATQVFCSLMDIQTREEILLHLSNENLQAIAPLNDGGWVGKYYSAQQITDLVRFDPLDLKIDSFTSLTRINEYTNLTSEDLSPAEDFRWHSADGLEIQGWLYRTPSKAKGTIVYVHGGPTYHSENALDDQIQYFVSQGFNVLDPNYRGSTGFNRSYTDAIKVDGWGGREQDDIYAGIEALIKAGVAQSGKVGITGTSYGGYSAWHAITHFPIHIISAAAPICGMTDLVVDYETTRPDLRSYSQEMMGGTPEQISDRYYKSSPINFVGNIKGRLLIVQGLQDPNVTPENVRIAKTALDAAGIEYQLLTFDNEGHGIDRPENLRILYTRLAEFFHDAFADEPL